MLSFFENDLVRRIIVGVILMALIFFGAVLRNDGKNKSKIVQIKKFGYAVQVLAIANAFALIFTDFKIADFGLNTFLITLGICLVIDIVFIIFVVHNVNKIVANAKTFGEYKK